jgi:hypothetical protein
MQEGNELRIEYTPGNYLKKGNQTGNKLRIEDDYLQDTYMYCNLRIGDLVIYRIHAP